MVVVEVGGIHFHNTNSPRRLNTKMGVSMSNCFNVPEGAVEEFAKNVSSQSIPSPIKELPSDGSKKELLVVCKAACDELSSFLQVLYSNLSGDSAKLKEDKSVFTIADGIVQETLKTCLFAGKFEAIVGEEDSTKVNITEKPYSVDDLKVREEFEPLIDQVREKLTLLGETINPKAYSELTVFIDPIDGTREFYTKMGEQCSICIGFAEYGSPVAGIVYRPIPAAPAAKEEEEEGEGASSSSSSSATWAAGCKSENEAFGNLDFQEPSHPNGFLTTNGSISPFIGQLIEELQFERVKSGGAGNKMLMVLEGKGTCYIQDRGVSRWDTCAAQAVLEAYGGILVKFHPFVESKEFLSYIYRKSDTNLDFVPGLSNLTPYNARVKEFAKGTIADNASQVLPYSNLSGLFALNKNGLEQIDRFYESIQKAKEAHPPAYD